MSGEQWTENEFWMQFDADPNCKLYRPVAEKLMNWATRHNLLEWTTKTEKAKLSSFTVRLKFEGKQYKMFQVWGGTGGTGKGTRNYEILFQYMRYPFESGSMLHNELRLRLDGIGGISLPAETETGGQRPNFAFNTIESPNHLSKFLSIFEWMIEKIEKGT